MRRAIAICFAIGLAGCSGSPQATVPAPAPPKLTGKETTGEKVALVDQYCRAQAANQCGGTTIRCDAYRRSFVKTCLVRAGVPPEYIVALTMN